MPVVSSLLHLFAKPLLYTTLGMVSFWHWHTHGLSATTPGITSLLYRRAQMLGGTTLPGASIRLLYECATDCLHRQPGPFSSHWDSRPLHARLLRHGPAQHAGERQALLPPGVLAHQTLPATIGECWLLCTGVGTRSLTHRQLGTLATALALPYRTLKRSLLASCPSRCFGTGMAQQPGLLSPFLPPERDTPLLAFVLLPWPPLWEAQEREVALPLSLWEMLLPVRCLRPLLRRYARRAYPQGRLIELDNTGPIDYFTEVYDGC